MPLSFTLATLHRTQGDSCSGGQNFKSLLNFPCLCEAFSMSPHLSTRLRWQWAIAILSASLHPGQQKDSMNTSHHRISCVLWHGSPSGTLPFSFGTGYACGAVQATTLLAARHQPFFHTATAISADWYKPRLTPLKLVDLPW